MWPAIATVVIVYGGFALLMWGAVELIEWQYRRAIRRIFRKP
jgi:hypothetical protein